MLVHEGGGYLAGPMRQLRIGGLDQRRHVRVPLLDPSHELDPGQRVGVPPPLEARVADDTQKVRAVPLEELPALFERFGQQNLGTALHSAQPLARIGPIRHQRLGLLHHLAIEHRQVGRVEPDRVLHQEDDPHAGCTGVPVHVPPVFDVLDDGEKDSDIAAPREDLVNMPGVVLFFHAVRLGGIVGQEHERQPGVGLFHLPSEADRVHLTQARARDDEIERAQVDRLSRRIGGGDLRDVRRVAQVELVVLGVQALPKGVRPPRG